MMTVRGQKQRPVSKVVRHKHFVWVRSTHDCFVVVLLVQGHLCSGQKIFQQDHVSF